MLTKNITGYGGRLGSEKKNTQKIDFIIENEKRLDEEEVTGCGSRWNANGRGATTFFSFHPLPHPSTIIREVLLPHNTCKSWKTYPP